MKKKIWIAALAAVLLLGVLFVVACAENAEPAADIYAYNLAFDNQVYLEYAVRVTGVSGAKPDEVGVLIWREGTTERTPETAAADLTAFKKDNVEGTACYVVKYTDLSAKEMTDKVYSQPYVKDGKNTVYGKITEYSICTYAERKLGLVAGVAGTTDEKLVAMLREMLDYGANAQLYFGYKTENLANAILRRVQVSYEDELGVENPNPGVFSVASGKVKLQPLSKAGYTFWGWRDDAGRLVSEIDTAAAKTMTLYAMWQADRYSVTYRNTMGVSNPNEESRSSYTVEESLQPEALKKYDYTFNGWRLGSPYGALLGEDGLPDGTTGNIDLYADWTLKPEFKGFSYVVDDNYFLPNGQNFCILMDVDAANDAKKLEIPAVFNHIQAGVLKFFGQLEELTLPFLGSDYTGTAGSYLGYVFGAYTALGQNDAIPKSLKKVTVNGSGRIGENAFRDCTSLVEIVVSGTSSDIGENAYLGCTSLVSLTTPVYYNDAMKYGTHSYPEYQTDFYYGIPGAVKGENRKNTLFGSTLTPDISVGSFETLHINGGEIGRYAFDNNCAIKHLIIEGVDVIRVRACSQLQYMETLELREGLKQIQNSAFYGCQNKNFTELIIPNSVTSLCGYDYDEVNGYEGPITGYSYPASTFHLCINLSKIVIGDGVEVIPSQCFDRHYPKTPLELTLGKKVRVIGHWALMAEVSGGFSCNISKLINNSEQEEMIVYWQGDDDGSEFLNILKNCNKPPKKIYLGSYEDGKTNGAAVKPITETNCITEEQLRSLQDTFELVLWSAENPYENGTALEGFDYWHGKDPQYYWIHSQYDEVVLWEKPKE